VPKEKVGLEFQRKKWGCSSKGKSGAGVPKEKVGLEFQGKKWGLSSKSGAGVPKEKVGLEFQRKKWGWSSKGKSGAIFTLKISKYSINIEFIKEQFREFPSPDVECVPMSLPISHSKLHNFSILSLCFLIEFSIILNSIIKNKYFSKF
jgi:hypothetical protein